MNLAALTKGWRDFWFKPISPKPMAVYRIWFGLLVLQIAVVHIGGDFLDWYGTHAILPIASVQRHWWVNEPHFDGMLLCGSDDRLLLAFFYLHILAAICLVLGFKTRIAAAFVCLSMLSMHNHQPYNINGGDSFLRLCSMFLPFSAAGEAFSIDEWLHRRQTGLRVKTCSPWAQRMIQVQLSLAYWHTFICKISGSQWLDGTAVYYATHLDDMFRFSLPFFNVLWCCKIFSWYTLIVEFSMWTLVWVKELRYYILFATLMLHLGIDYAINLPVFEWAFISALVLFVDAGDVCKAADWCKKMAARKVKSDVLA